LPCKKLDAFAAAGGAPFIAHADEFETSLYLHLAPERVRMDRAVAGHDIMGRYVSSDSTANYPVRFTDIWGRWTNTGAAARSRIRSVALISPSGTF